MPAPRLLPTLAGLGAALLLPAPAVAGEINRLGTNIFGAEVRYADAGFDANTVHVGYDGAYLLVTDAAGLTLGSQSGAPAGTACTPAALPGSARCPGPLTRMIAFLGAQGDTWDGSDTCVEQMLVGESGQDKLTGGCGADVLTGNGEMDTLHGGEGADLLADGTLYALIGDAGDGNDLLYGDSGDDTFAAGSWGNGGTGNDLMHGGTDVAGDTADYANRTSRVVLSLDGVANDGEPAHAEADQLVAIEDLTGTPFDDALTGSVAPNDLRGNPGADALTGLAGADRLFGGEGDDELDGGPGADTYDGGPGTDALSYAAAAGPVTVRLNGVADDGQAGEGDDVGASVEVVAGSASGDTFAGDGDRDVFRAGAGDDGLDGGEGDDDLGGEAGADAIAGGAGDDAIDGGPGADALEGGLGDDDIRARDGDVDGITCGAGTDTVEADAADSVFGDCESVGRPPAGETAPPPPGDTTQSTPPPDDAPAPVTIGPGRPKVDAQGRGTLRIACPAAAPTACAGRVTLRRSGRRASRAAVYTVAPGTTVRARFRLLKAARAALERRGTVRVTAVATAPVRTTRALTLVRKRAV